MVTKKQAAPLELGISDIKIALTDAIEAFREFKQVVADMKGMLFEIREMVKNLKEG